MGAELGAGYEVLEDEGVAWGGVCGKRVEVVGGLGESGEWEEGHICAEGVVGTNVFEDVAFGGVVVGLLLLLLLWMEY